jgi:hypothetical protein
MTSGETTRPDGIEKIADPKMNEDDVVRLIETMRSTEPTEDEAKLWAIVANSDRYPDVRRRRAILQLFDRHLRPGMTVGQLSKLLADASWLKRENVSVVRELGGKIPIRIVPGETVSVLMPKLPPSDASGVYLRVQDSPLLESFYNGLLGKESAVTTVKITAMGIFALDADDQRLNNSGRAKG